MTDQHFIRTDARLNFAAFAARILPDKSRVVAGAQLVRWIDTGTLPAAHVATLRAVLQAFADELRTALASNAPVDVLRVADDERLTQQCLAVAIFKRAKFSYANQLWRAAKKGQVLRAGELTRLRAQLEKLAQDCESAIK